MIPPGGLSVSFVLRVTLQIVLSPYDLLATVVEIKSTNACESQHIMPGGPYLTNCYRSLPAWREWRSQSPKF